MNGLFFTHNKALNLPPVFYQNVVEKKYKGECLGMSVTERDAEQNKPSKLFIHL